MSNNQLTEKNKLVPCYFLNGDAIPVQTVVKDLLVDNRLSFIPHYNYIISKGNKS